MGGLQGGRLAVLVGSAVVVDGLMLWSSWVAGVLPADSFAVWAAVVVALSLACGVVAEIGLARWRDVQVLCAVPLRPVLRILGAGALLVLALLVVGVVLQAETDRPVPWRGAVISLVAAAAGGPVAATMLAVGIAARSQGAGLLGRRVRIHLELYRLARSLLPPLGTLVTLTTVALAVAQRGTAAQVGAAGADTDTLRVIIFGAVGSALVGLLYAFSHASLQASAQCLATVLVPLEGVEESKDAVDAMARRATVEGQLGLGSNLLEDLRSSVLVVTPLLSTATAALLG